MATPIVANENLLVQINGAPYIKGSSSGSLNPEDILVKQNSSKIQVQIHSKLASSIISLLLKEKGGYIGLTLHSLDITSIIDIDSLHLSPVFPKMASFEDNRDVIFNLKSPEVNFAFRDQNIRLEVSLFTDVATYNSIDRR
mgnify:CR=1 FL=1